MMTSVIQVLAELTLTTSVAVVVVALCRRLLRRIAGIQIAYWLWLLVPISGLAALLPALPFEIGGSNAFPATLRDAVNIETYSAQVAHAIVDYSSFGTILWVAGCVFMLALSVHRQLALLRSLADAKLVADNICSSPSVHGPLLVGVFRPRIVVPIDFESKYAPEDRALILAHEQAHLRRGDILISGIATLWRCVFWFNPLMHWALVRLRLDQELACDAAVLAASRIGRRRYADALLRTHLANEAYRRAPLACCWQSDHPLKERIVMLSRPLPTFSRRLCGASVTAALIFSGGCAGWSARPKPAQVEPDQASHEESTIRADRVVKDNDDTLLSGNVVITLVSNAARVSFSGPGSRVQKVGEDHVVLEALGDLRLAAAKFVITAERGHVEQNGATMVLTTDSARISPVAPTN
jgi:beta-lactamase regulating signal transducer with metallopeptidase domain